MDKKRVNYGQKKYVDNNLTHYILMWSQIFYGQHLSIFCA